MGAPPAEAAAERRGAPPVAARGAGAGAVVEEPPEHICWHEARRQWGWRCRGDHTGDLLVIFGACRADGERWFWSAKAHEETVIERHGFEPSAVRARIKARMSRGRSRERPADHRAGER